MTLGIGGKGQPRSIGSAVREAKALVQSRSVALQIEAVTVEVDQARRDLFLAQDTHASPHGVAVFAEAARTEVQGAREGLSTLLGVRDRGQKLLAFIDAHVDDAPKLFERKVTPEAIHEARTALAQKLDDIEQLRRGIDVLAGG